MSQLPHPVQLLCPFPLQCVSRSSIACGCLKCQAYFGFISSLISYQTKNPISFYLNLCGTLCSLFLSLGPWGSFLVCVGFFFPTLIQPEPGCQPNLL